LSRLPGWVSSPRFRTVARGVLLVAMLGFAVLAVVREWGGLTDALGRLSVPELLLAFVPAVLAMVAAVFVWRTVLADLGARLPVRAAARIFFPSQLGKYLPGSIWSVVTQMELGRAYKVPPRTSLATGALAIAVSVGVGLPLAGVTLVFGAPDAVRRYWWALPCVLVILVCLHPRIVGGALELALRVLRRPPLPRRPTWRGMATAAGYQVLNWLAMGLHAWFLLIAMGAPAGRALPVAIGGFALAYGLGLLAIPVPAGAGIRDAALVVTFATVVPTSTALAVALVSRVILTVVDVGLASTVYAAVHGRRLSRRADRPAGTDPTGDPAAGGEAAGEQMVSGRPAAE
jgi:uncharacterized membrane protein YbhN (UPF0104 family)